MRSLLDEADSRGSAVQYGIRVAAVVDGGGVARVRTNAGVLEAAVAVNCAGLQADRVAGGVASDVRVIPFRGFYAELVPER